MQKNLNNEITGNYYPRKGRDWVGIIITIASFLIAFEILGGPGFLLGLIN